MEYDVEDILVSIGQVGVRLDDPGDLGQPAEAREAVT